MKSQSISKSLSLVRGLFLIVAILLSAFGPIKPALADNAGTALQFNGTSQYVTFGSAAGTTTGLGVQVFTIELWFKRTGTGATTTTGSGGLSTAIPLVSKGRGEGDNSNLDMNYFFGIDNATGRLAADFEECSPATQAPDCLAGGTAGLNHPAYGSTAIQTNVWYHAAVTYDGRYWKFYLNGVQDGATTDVGAVRYPRWDSIQHAGIGTAMTSTGAAAGFFAGITDEVRVWNVVRTQAEIQADMYDELTSGTGLIGRWGLNEGSGTTAANSIAGRPNGTLTGTPTWVTGFPLPDLTPPAAPTGLAASPFNGGIYLSWNPNAETDLTGYNLYRGIATGGPYTKVNSALISGTSYNDGGLTNGTDYYYVIRAVDASTNESADSDEASATPESDYGNSLVFDGTNDYVTFGLASDLGVKTFTLETWFRRTGAGAVTYTGSGGVIAVPLVTKGMAESDAVPADMNYFFGIESGTNYLIADFEECSPATQAPDCLAGGTAGLNHPVKGTTPILNDVWYHAAVTYDGRYFKIYLNGILDGQLDVGAVRYPRWDSTQHAALGTALQSTGSPGSSSGYGPGYFQGVMDETRVWNVARSQADIQNTIDMELVTQPGLIGNWGMNEGSGATISDSTTPAVNGTLVNGPVWSLGAPFDIVFTAPVAPTSLTAAASSPTNINLGWTDNATNESSYEIQRGNASGGPFSALATLDANANAYADSTVLPLTQYCYRVRAVNGGGASDYSDVACATTPNEPAYALDFGTGSAYVTFGDAAPLKLSQFTLEGWFKREGAGATANTGTGGFYGIPLITKGVGEAENSNVDMNYFLGIRDTDDVICADFEEGAGGATPGQNHPVCGTTVIANDTWYHVAATYDGGTWRIYLNGAPEATLAVNQPVRSDSIQHAGLGAALNSTGTASGHFDGVLDEVRIWNYARTRIQILSTINSQVSTSQTGLVGRWSLNEGSGTTVNGSAGTTVNGTVTGTGSSWVTPGAPFNVVIDTTPPDAPTGLMSAAGPGQVSLEWTNNIEPDLAGYNVYRSTTSPVTIGTPLNLSVIAPPAYVDTNVTAGVQYYYAVTAVDSYGNESALSAETSATPLTPPPAEALDLGSAQAYVPLGDNADISQFTLEAWVRRDGAGTAVSTGTGGVTLLPLITNGTAEAETADADINYFFGIRGTDGVLCADFEEAQTGSAPGQNHPACGVTPLTNGLWYHVAVTYDGATWRLYLNGDLDKELAVNQPANAANLSQLALGTSLKTDNSTNGFFDGAFDEVRIWNVARSQAQILSTINSKLSTPQAGLIGRWGLDEGTGSAVTDSSGSGINGTISGTGYSWIPGAPFNITVNLPPDEPALSVPADGATNVPVPATLSVTVSDPESDPVDVTFYGRPLQAAAGPDFAIIAIPDPQYYASTYPSIYNAQMNWVVANDTSSNIAYVASLGDNVDVASTISQWTNADAAWDILDAANIPYGLEAGNHDGAPSGTANFNTYFGTSRFTGKPWYGGHYGSDNDNHYALFETSGLKFIVIFIEYDDTMTSTSNPVLVWANDLLQTYSDRRAIVVTHNLLQGGTSTSFTTQGQIIYDALKANPNLFLMLGGHLDVAARRTDTYNGNTVYSLRSDYQSVDSQQSGYLRIMRFSPTDNMIYVRTYSPTQDKEYDKSDAAQSNFDLPYMMDGINFEVIGTANDVPSGGTASISWTGLDPEETYEWYAVASDGSHQTRSATWTFTTAAAAPTCYALTLSHTGQGSDPVAAPSNSAGCASGQYVAGENISLSNATPNAGWQISGWTGTNNNFSTASTNTLTMPASAHAASVTYTQTEYTLTVVSAHGTVTKTPDQPTYHLGDTVQLSATPEAGWTFVNWTGGVTGTANPINVNITGNMTVTANYSQNEYTLTVVSAHGTVTKTPDQPTYHLGDTVQLSATPEAGWTFVNWTGGVTGTANPISVNITGNMTVTANYAQNEYTLTVVSAHGTVTKTPDQPTYHLGDTVQLSATPEAGWTFVNWTGGVTGTTNPISVNITGNMTVTANYSQNEYTLTVVSAHGTVTKTPDQPTYHLGDTVQLSATPEAGWTFINWTGGATGTANPISVNITGNMTVTANYFQNEYTLTVVSAHGTVTKTPDQPTYHLGDTVQLSATPETGWTFVDWTGDATGTTNPVDITIVGNMTVTANYVFGNQPPTDVTLSSNTVVENLPAGTVVGTLATVDADAGDTHTYSFACSIPGADDASFQIGGANSDELQTAAVFDYETKNSYSICVRTDDGHSGTFDKNLTITVTNANETLTATFRSVGAYDGWILESGENTTVGGTLNSTATTFNLGDDAQNKQYRVILSFNTTTLPDTAVITKVTLKIRKQVSVGTNPFTILGGLKVDMRKPFFGTTLGLTVPDFQAVPGRIAVATFGTTPVNNWYSALLSAAGRNYLNKTGVTQFRLYFAVGDNNNRVADYMKFFSGNYATASARPTLIIQYYVP